MTITSQQKISIASLTCERLSSNSDNIRDIEDFYNLTNNGIAETLKNEAYAEDESGAIAYYIVKNPNGEILFFFSLKCGLLYEEFVDGEKLNALKKFYDYIKAALLAEETDIEYRAVLSSLLESTRTKKAMKQADVAYFLGKDPKDIDVRDFVENGVKNVGKTFSGLEIVHFCANDKYRYYWNSLHIGKSLGSVVFWHFIVPIVNEVMKCVGCEYLFLFAADLTLNEHLINYYKDNLNFRDTTELGVAMPLYDFGCKFMYQRTDGLQEAREQFFASFNEEDAV